ncbi:hypothetical protein A3I95_00380 [Candidatus Nomurabacteria bacterium RIFCSPLOWO2_02_FULL_44_12]|uniref:DNA polymerase III delta N-terminal domain-containing protein n=1 Tax=Candidatus Nomurabacteria bacterium RIFCSPLOWO2_12_FULL_44_11 TaxID=1801796 RepID=A0A1F6Y6M4_9BACT|nr:MAG: hypothetical protein A3E95_02705 [Candidatus Nomurabacteria bacterium RIFCSPHIGHO2_12_FULL_44_22b]OGJ02014.1 MAG: hypothetical protein A3G53_01895 [Candidatus Nomurabacteria bacterium RIFCSPLOWO2_12_FULL_44_11]OGJ08730.1 MAG: hypothetical protein A3I95_00380 [Candidatus Nomurabacteria bacterium RIFCSPLOWO2_02_FULL_44_12]
MLYLFAGDDAPKKILNYEKFLGLLPKEVEVFSFNRSDFDKLQIESFCSGAGLFFKKSAVIFSGALEREETREFILSKLQSMGESPNYFVFIESRIGKPVIDLFKKARTELNIYELPKEKKEKFNNFLLADALAQRDKLNLWLYFRQAVDLGVGLEELAGVLFWKAKDMILKKNLGKFKEPELKNFASKLSYLLPEARKRGRDAEAAFEEFLLEAV